MKKLMTILVVFAMCGVAMAQTNYQLQDGKTHDYANMSGKTALKYTATNFKTNTTSMPWYTSSSSYGNAHLYFTTLSAAELAKTGKTTVAVQFLAADLDTDLGYNKDNPQNFTHNLNYHGHDIYNIADYGIYLYDPQEKKMIGDYMSVKTYGNYFDIGADKSFGVYYVDDKGNICTTTDNWVGNYDNNSHTVMVHNMDGTVTEETTQTRFMCLFGKQWSGYETDHWEFMLQTSLSNPYLPVDPNEFPGGVPVDNPVVHGDQGGPSGQPLPGTLATLLIGSLCASALRKKNQK